MPLSSHPLYSTPYPHAPSTPPSALTPPPLHPLPSRPLHSTLCPHTPSTPPPALTPPPLHPLASHSPLHPLTSHPLHSTPSPHTLSIPPPHLTPPTLHPLTSHPLHSTQLPPQQLLLNMNFSSRTSSMDVQRTLESNVEKRTKDSFGPPPGKRLLVFIDDMNMPKVRCVHCMLHSPFTHQQMCAVLHVPFYTVCGVWEAGGG